MAKKGTINKIEFALFFVFVMRNRRNRKLLRKELVRKDTIHLTKLIVGIGKDQ